MKRVMLVLSMLIVLTVGITSCIGETRRGTPNPNSQPQPVNQD